MYLLYSPASPFSNKVRMAAHYLGLPVEHRLTDTSANPPDLIDSNPLGKIPTLVLDDGSSVHDSRVIMHFLDRETDGGLYPRRHDKRLKADMLEALCDGICDSLLAIVYEKRFHPPEKVHQPWIDRQWEKVIRALDLLNADLPKPDAKLHGGHFALAATLRYLDLRFEGQWQGERRKLVKWPKKFVEYFPDYDRFKA
ncbi:glutathione S-transferase [Xaviernesmea oryzae]|uniref:Glutathione S-transferase n=1 Tax=Xaviernesmea oryzae TaxID=464029 RepID=A0A1Q9ASY6_9HYPH|nr:glutathione S-transferase [Xaviernesmea oryzae]OLP58523.1 glutathione S-transferase [Xaviernesmea oryzae]SEK60504.1 glutathione S-transferase [Xaviernesmea oryzae]